ncbi:ABCB10 [Lepeophtheirus salmonis]|uniref:ABCB10 n=1 Tax=Lepeophtheirus salmonis TaxID=72036 RepID=A0A7R8H4A8_LEPSM|nr:ABCB10 [Lepeophtheirus salmonis]CAF2859882.1 ABCB10 [Lepeophtheirus salmonis]
MLSRLLRTGVVTLGRRNISFSRPKGKEWKKLFEFAYPERKAIGGAMGLILISTSGVTMSVPEEKASTRSRLNSLCTALVVVFGIGAICNFGRVYLIQLSGQRITARIRSRLFSSITKQETAFFDTNKTGELVNRLSSDSMLVSQALTSQISSGMRSSIMALAGVAGWAVWMGKKVKNISHEYQNTLADATHLAQERIANIRTVRAFGKEVQETKFYGMTGLTGNLIILSVMFYEIMKALGAATRIWEIMDRTTHNAFRYRYPSRPDHSIFDGLNLNIESKQILAIVGSSGSGKSTLTSLLLRLYDPNMGRVCIDGTDIRELNTTWLRNQIGIVMQEPGKIEHEEIVSAAKESNAHDFIMNFPDRYDTLVGERGGFTLWWTKTEGLLLREPFLKNPQILILDEATSALDAASEHETFHNSKCRSYCRGSRGEKSWRLGHTLNL